MKLLNTLTLILTCTIFIGCNDKEVASGNSKKSTDTIINNGTSDGGGGIVEGSSAEDIKTAIYATKEVLKRDKFWLIIMNNLPSDAPKEARSLAIDAIGCLIWFDSCPSVGLDKELQEISRIPLDNFEEWNTRFEIYKEKKEKLPKDLSQFLDRLQIKLQADGACTYGDGKEADASVSEFTHNGIVCFSLKTLQRIPKQSLNQHILGLWMHEISHLNGYHEDEAKIVEQATVKSYLTLTSGDSSRATDILTTHLHMALNSLSSASAYLADYTYQENKDYNLSSTFAYLGASASALYLFINTFDEPSYLTTKLYYAPEVEEQKNKIIEKSKMIYNRLYVLIDGDKSNPLEPKILKSEALSVEFDSLLQEILSLQKDFYEIMEAYK